VLGTQRTNPKAKIGPTGVQRKKTGKKVKRKCYSLTVSPEFICGNLMSKVKLVGIKAQIGGERGVSHALSCSLCHTHERDTVPLWGP
jgi:hypothetical protein